MTASTARRLGKAVALLGSASDGEALAAARAIGRTLQAAGLDWHRFAELVTGAAARLAAPAFTFATTAPRTARKLMAHLARQGGVSEADRARLERYRMRLLGAKKLTLTEDDIAWLDALWHRAHGEAVL